MADSTLVAMARAAEGAATTAEVPGDHIDAKRRRAGCVRACCLIVTFMALGLAIGSDVQAFSSVLSTYAGINPSANVQTLLGSANYAACRTNLFRNHLGRSGARAHAVTRATKVVDDQHRAFARKLQRVATTEAATGTRYNRYLSIQESHVLSPKFCVC